VALSQARLAMVGVIADSKEYIGVPFDESSAVLLGGHGDRLAASVGPGNLRCAGDAGNREG
jgi:hypothetical protein